MSVNDADREAAREYHDAIRRENRDRRGVAGYPWYGEDVIAAFLAGIEHAGLTWTGAAPTEAGWYWWWYAGLRTRIVEVQAWPGGGLAVCIPERSDHSDGVTTPELAAGFWAGPLPQPPEPRR